MRARQGDPMRSRGFSRCNNMRVLLRSNIVSNRSSFSSFTGLLKIDRFVCGRFVSLPSPRSHTRFLYLTLLLSCGIWNKSSYSLVAINKRPFQQHPQPSTSSQSQNRKFLLFGFCLCQNLDPLRQKRRKRQQVLSKEKNRKFSRHHIKFG